MLVYRSCGWNFRRTRRKKKKKRDKTSGEGGGRIVNECGSHNEKGSSSSRDSNLVSSSFLCSRGDLIVEICNAA